MKRRRLMTPGELAAEISARASTGAPLELIIEALVEAHIITISGRVVDDEETQ